MNFLKKTGTAASIEAKYLEGKARGFRHPPEVTEQLEIYKQQTNEVKKLKKVINGIYKEEKSLTDIEEKAAKVYTEESTAENQNPKGATVFRMYADCRTQVSTSRMQYVNTLLSIVNDWKQLSKVEIGKLEKMLDTANRTLVTRQYYEGNRDYIPAKQWDDKYTTQITSFVDGVHDLRKQKEVLHPQLVLRKLQAEQAFYRSIISQFEMCEAAIRNLGLVEPIKFTGFFMESKQYAGGEGSASSGDKLNSANPYAGIQSTPQGYGQPQQVTVTTTQYVQPLPPQLPPQHAGLRARGLYAFTGSSPAEMSFAAGEILNIVSQDGAWWTAECNGRRGYIPSNYVELI